MKKVGILYDNISGNMGDQAIGISVRKMLAEMGVDYEELVPGRFNPDDYSTIIVGGGHLLRPSPDFFYDKFRVQGQHILNCCGIVGSPNDLQHLDEYPYVTVRSKGDRRKLSYLTREIGVVPCTTMLLKDLPQFDLKIESPSIGVHVLGSRIDEKGLTEYLARQPFHVYLLPITHYNRDFAYLAELSEKMPNATLLPILRPEEIFTLIGRFDYFISMSLHGAIFAYVHNVPFLLYESQEKKRFFMADRGLAESLFKDLDGLRSEFEELLNHRPDYSARLSSDFKVLEEHKLKIRDILLKQPVTAHTGALMREHISESEEQRDSLQEMNFQVHYLQSQVELLAAQSRQQIAHSRTLETSIREGVSHIHSLESHIHSLESHAHSLELHIHRLERSIPMQLVRRYQRIVDRLLRPGTRRRRPYDLALTGVRVILSEGWRSFWTKFRYWLRRYRGLPVGGFAHHPDPYQLWIDQNEPKPEELEKQRALAVSFKLQPKLSIIASVSGMDEESLRAAIGSLLDQVYEKWELCIAEGDSLPPHMKGVLQEYAGRDSRIKVGYVSDDLDTIDALNTSFSSATGDFTAFLEEGVLLRPHALFEVVSLLNDNRDLDLIYSDEDRIDRAGNRADPFFKPDWSPDLLMSMNYIGRFAVIRRELLDDLGPVRKGFEASPYYDLLLRATARTPRIAHIAKPLYSVCEAHGSPPQSARSAEMTALRESLAARGLDGEVLEGYHAGQYRVRYRIEDNPLVSVIIPTRDERDKLSRCIESIESKTTYKNYELIIVDHDSCEPKAAEYLRTSGHRVVRYDGTFNFARMNNIAAEQANGSYLVFLNNDTEVIEPAWLEAMLEHAQRDEVGMVGCLLLYPPGTPLADTVQHAGVVLGIGIANHIFRFRPASSPGYFGLHRVVRNCSAVTAACAMMRKSLFESVGGFDESFAVAYNDVDLCLRLRERGLLIVYTPFAVLYHHEGATRGPKAHPEDDAGMLTRWRDTIASGDPYYNPNLTLDKSDFSIRTSNSDTSSFVKVQ